MSEATRSDSLLTGIFSRRTRWDPRPNALAVALARRGARPYADLTVSNPTAVDLAFPETKILRAFARREALRYQPDARGLPAARAAVAAYYRERDGGAMAPTAAPLPAPVAATVAAPAADDLILTAGTSEAYAHLFRLLCDPGDRVHVPRPSYPLLDLLAESQDVELRRYPLWRAEEWHLDVAALEADLTARSRAIVVIDPNNPTGSYTSAAEWSALSDLATRHRLALIVDEVFYDYRWPPRPDAPPRPRAITAPLAFVLNGLSKLCALPQAKLAWIAVMGQDAALRAAARERLEVLNDIFLSASGPTQWAAEELLSIRAELQSPVRARVAENLAAVDEILAPAAERLVPGAVSGGWTVCLRPPATRDDETWAELCLERADVLTHPGHFYDFAPENVLVASLLPRPDVFAAALRRARAVLAQP